MLKKINKKKWLLLGLLIYVALTLCRELGVFDISIYKSTATHSSQCIFNNSGDKITIPIAQLSNNEMDSDCFFPFSERSIPIELLCDGERYGDENPNTCISITVDIDYGFTWTPLVKNVNYSANANFFGSVEEWQRKDSLVDLNVFSPNGSVSVTGKLIVYGICSSRTAKRLIRQDVEKAVYQTIKRQINQPH